MKFMLADAEVHTVW